MTFATEFNFTKKSERALSLDEIPPPTARTDGHYYWADFESEPPEVILPFLERLGLDELTLETIFDEDGPPRFNVFQSCLHFTLREARIVNGQFITRPVQVILGPHFMLTVHQGQVDFLRDVQRTYREDFHAHSQSHGFLLFELADHLTHVYRMTLTVIGEMIETIEAQLLGETEDEIFHEVSNLIRWLLEFRKIIISSRETIHELATRKSPFISETTQPFLEKKGVLLERLSADATTEREVLSESLTLYMGIVSYRTNEVLTRLTMVSMIFLPLSFLAGVYGMNFGPGESSMPELTWRYGYGFFWVLVLLVAGGLVYWMKRSRWL